MEGNLISRGVEDGRHDENEGSMLYGTPYILYQLELPWQLPPLLTGLMCHVFSILPHYPYHPRTDHCIAMNDIQQ